MDAALVIVFCLFLVESNESGVLFRHALPAPLSFIDTARADAFHLAYWCASQRCCSLRAERFYSLQAFISSCVWRRLACMSSRGWSPPLSWRTCVVWKLVCRMVRKVSRFQWQLPMQRVESGTGASCTAESLASFSIVSLLSLFSQVW